MSLVEPGFFRTSLHESAQHGATRIADYGSMRQTLEAAVDRAISQGDDPVKVAEVIVRIAQSTSPRLRYRVGSGRDLGPSDESRPPGPSVPARAPQAIQPVRLVPGTRSRPPLAAERHASGADHEHQSRLHSRGRIAALDCGV